jgi:hypothetical protein
MPEFLVLMPIVCRYDAHPKNLDAAGARQTHAKTDFLISSWDPGTLWTDFGIRADIVVSLAYHVLVCL